MEQNIATINIKNDTTDFVNRDFPISDLIRNKILTTMKNSTLMGAIGLYIKEKEFKESILNSQPARFIADMRRTRKIVDSFLLTRSKTDDFTVFIINQDNCHIHFLTMVQKDYQRYYNYLNIDINIWK